VSRLVVVSNRVALPGAQQSGGLATALHAALSQRGGVWFGWSGEARAKRSGALHETADGAVSYVTMDLSRKDHNEYYNSFSNRTLWPLLHFRPDLVDYSRETFEGYRRVNALFADALAKLVKAGDLVWVHDYHLFPLGALLRERGVKARIGFFLHTPLPSADLLSALPDHARVFSRLTAYDLLGFQTARDLDHYRDYVRMVAGGHLLDEQRLRAPDGREFRAGAFPISIDTDLIATQAVTAVRQPPVRRLQESLAGRVLAIGVDRLDYSKGLPERFAAYGRLFHNQKDARGRISFLQIAPPSRSEVPEYRHLRERLEQQAGHINGMFADPEWVPIRYVNRSYAHSTLTGFYRLAQVGVVTPFRDGMNLVAKEFVAAQNEADPGVLVLSCFAGAADEMDAALIVNPFDIDGVAEALHAASTMPREERRERWQTLMTRLREHNIGKWCSEFLRELQQTGKPPPAGERRSGERRQAERRGNRRDDNGGRAAAR